MKKILIFAAICFVFTSCIKPEDFEPEVKDYTCKCDYVVTPLNQDTTAQNFAETTTVKATYLEDARFECSSLEDKYFSGHHGTCLIQ